MSACITCGTTSNPDAPTPQNCPACPPERCDECGEMNVWSTGEMCACWVSVEELPIADLKGLFAPDFNVNTDGSLTT